MHYTHYYNIIIFVQSPGSVVRRTRTHRSRCCIWNWRKFKNAVVLGNLRASWTSIQSIVGLIWSPWNVHLAKVDFVFDKGETIFGWCQSIFLMLWNFFLKNPCILSQLTYYEYFCRKIELVSLFFHPGPRWIWNREKHEKRSLWLLTQKIITRSTSSNSAKDDWHSLLNDDERGLNSENQTDWR